MSSDEARGKKAQSTMGTICFASEWGRDMVESHMEEVTCELGLQRVWQLLSGRGSGESIGGRGEQRVQR